MITWLILTISFLSSIYFYINFPETVASHWNFRGEVDGYSGRFGGAFVIPILLVVMYLLFLVLPNIDPHKERYKEFKKEYGWMRDMIIGTLVIVYVSSGLYNLGYPIKIGIVVPIVIGLMMIVMGSFMRKLKRNCFVGIKTPWTLASENVWDKTHKMGGYAFVIFGLCIMVAPFLPEVLGICLFIFGILLAVVGTIAYSYFEYRREKV